MRLVFVGWGAIARTAADMLDGGAVDIVAVTTRGRSQPEGLPASVQLISDPADLTDLRPDVVAEAASRESVAQWGPASLAAGADFIVSSVSAFADSELLDRLRLIAAEHSAQVQIQPGALAGVEALAAARATGIDEVEHRIVKPPGAWSGTPAERLCALDGLGEPEAFFSGNAAETATAFPKNANVAMTTALAGIGPDRTRITLVADPTATKNRHELRARGAFGELDVAISNNPLPANPKTSALAAYSLVRAIQNHTTPIVI